MLHLKTSNFTCPLPAAVLRSTMPGILIMLLILCVFTSITAIAEDSQLKDTLLKLENKKYFRQEPIFPIPQVVLVNIKKAELGEKLFSETRFSKNNKISCASCHQLKAGGDDNLPLSISLSDAQHTVNTPTIFNAQFNFRQNWDGSAKTLAEQINGTFKSHHEFDNQWDDVLSLLAKDKKLVDEFYKVYSHGISKQTVIDALVEFEKTLITPNAPFDKYLKNEKNSLTDDEIKGYLTFKELGCISCHQGINIGGNLYQKFGVFYNYIAERGDIKKADYGRMNITDRYVDAFVFKVPTLRNIAVTAPYLHDGSAATLEEAISIMGKTQLGRTLTKEEIRLLKSFLYTLTGEYNNISLDDRLPDREI